jgi:hypothetical protein
MQYAFVAGLLDANLPNVTFIVELPFPCDDVLHGLVNIVVPMSAMRTGEADDVDVRLRFGSIMSTRRTSIAPFDYLKSLPGRRDRSYRLPPTPSSKAATTRAPVTIVELTTRNVLPDAKPDVKPGEAGVRLFNRCLEALNRYLAAYIVATEDHAVRPVSPEALGFFALVEFRDEDLEPLGFGGMLTLPRATTPASWNKLGDDEILARLAASMSHEAVRHPMDTVVLWQARARHYSQVIGDYEMALLALNISGEVLLDAIWDAHRVDDGRDSSLYEDKHQFFRTLKTVSADLGAPFHPDGSSPWTRYVHDCYDIRNETAHEGRQVTSAELDDAISAYDGLRRYVEQRTIATAVRYPRTALMVHGTVGLRQAGVLHGPVAEVVDAIRAEDAAAFWLPHDLR